MVVGVDLSQRMNVQARQDLLRQKRQLVDSDEQLAHYRSLLARARLENLAELAALRFIYTTGTAIT